MGSAAGAGPPPGAAASADDAPRGAGAGNGEQDVNICVIGSGYVGLVTGACFAEFGVQVRCADNDPEKVARLQQGEVPIYEPGLDEIVERNLRQSYNFV